MRWRSELGADIPVSVNFSGAHFSLAGALSQYEKKFSILLVCLRILLMVEITEGVLIEDPIMARQLIAEICELGCALVWMILVRDTQR